jgi:methylenetetrahydrofolate reductase (NADPH)
MRIDERLAAGGEPVLSFEFLPPRSVEAELAFWRAVEELSGLEPAFVSVTYGAGGSTRELTLALVRRLAREHRLEAMPHLTCVGSTRDQLRGLLAEIAAQGAGNVLALRGDLPRGHDPARPWTPPAGGLGSAAELAALAREAGDLCVAGACYPESAELDYIRAKVDAGVSVLVTQLFFDNRDYFRFVERLRAAGIDVPVLPGIIPIASAAQVKRLATLCRASVPDGLRRELEQRADDPAAAAQLGIAYATAQCAELLDAGVPGLHFYTFNRSPATLSIVGALRAQGRWASAVAGH